MKDPFADGRPRCDRNDCPAYNYGSNGKPVGGSGPQTLTSATDTHESARRLLLQPVGRLGHDHDAQPGLYYHRRRRRRSSRASSPAPACTIVLTNQSTATDATIGKFKMNAGAELNLTAPTTGEYRASRSTRTAARPTAPSKNNKINGNSAAHVIGALYFPSQELIYNGDGTTTAICTRSSRGGSSSAATAPPATSSPRIAPGPAFPTSRAAAWCGWWHDAAARSETCCATSAARRPSSWRWSRRSSA